MSCVKHAANVEHLKCSTENDRLWKDAHDVIGKHCCTVVGIHLESTNGQLPAKVDHCWPHWSDCPQRNASAAIILFCLHIRTWPQCIVRVSTKAHRTFWPSNLKFVAFLRFCDTLALEIPGITRQSCMIGGGGVMWIGFLMFSISGLLQLKTKYISQLNWTVSIHLKYTH